VTFRPVRLSRRAVANHLAFLNGETQLAPVPERKPRGKTGKQKESLVNDSVYEWGNYRSGRLYRNRRGMVKLPGGGMFPYGLGPNGTGDMIGYIPVLITAAMVGKYLPIYTEVESKTKTGRLEAHQVARIESLRADAVISGCVRSPEDCEEMYARWLASVTGSAEELPK
jgi:hypothetical protein